MKSLQQHGIREVQKQLRLRLKNTGLLSVTPLVTRRAGKLNISFSGSDLEIAKAEKILADWT